MRNQNLYVSRNNRNDEFYTRYEDIHLEISLYVQDNPDTFRGKTVYCNCDNPYYSQFFRYFVDHFNEFGLHQLISTNYCAQKYDPEYPENAPNRVIIRAVHPSITRDSDLAYVVSTLRSVDTNEWGTLEGDGDFRSPECMSLLSSADIVVTNPPFSLFNEYVPLVMSAHKRILVVGSMNGVSYRNVFPYILEKTLWMGASRRNSMWFFNPFHEETQAVHIFWYTNIPHQHHPEPLVLDTMEGNLRSNKLIIKNPDSYQRYDNYDAIEVPYTRAIPSDCTGVMGVPVSFMHKYCPDQFDIVGLTSEWIKMATKKYTVNAEDQTQNDKAIRTIISNMNKTAVIRVDRLPVLQKWVYRAIGDYYYRLCYMRILIQHRHPHCTDIKSFNVIQHSL